MSLSGDHTVSVIRAFSYFSHLANIAEDRHHLRRRRVHERQGHLQEGSLALAFERLARRGVTGEQIVTTLNHAFISPVLTAHPTEVQRKSILDAERAIAELLAARTPQASERELADNEALIRARVTQLWQTRMLRTAKLTVDDEIENALSYYRATFLAQIPILYREIEEALPGHDIASFFRMGNWIGGDRDGNPFVGAATLQTAFMRQSETVLRHYLTQVHELGAELSNSATLQAITPQMQALADASGDASPHRDDEPYRRALIGIYARLAATLQVLTGTEALRHAIAPSAPYAAAAELLADLRTIEASLVSHHAEALVRPRLAPLDARGAGVRLPPRDRRPAPELRQARGRRRRAARGGAHRGRLLGARRAGAARAAAARAQRRAAAARRRERARRGVQRGEPERAGDLRDRGRDAAPLRPRGAAPLHHLAHRKRQRPARGAGAAEGSRPAARHARR